jgi:hypothetical protein
MEESLKSFRKQAKARANQRYPQPLRQLGCEYARERITRGDTIGTIERQLGVAEQTLRNCTDSHYPRDFVPIRKRCFLQLEA